jgi:hypothetical protein
LQRGRIEMRAARRRHRDARDVTCFVDLEQEHDGGGAGARFLFDGILRVDVLDESRRNEVGRGGALCQDGVGRAEENERDQRGVKTPLGRANDGHRFAPRKRRFGPVVPASSAFVHRRRKGEVDRCAPPMSSRKRPDKRVDSAPRPID